MDDKEGGERQDRQRRAKDKLLPYDGLDSKSLRLSTPPRPEPLVGSSAVPDGPTSDSPSSRNPSTRLAFNRSNPLRKDQWERAQDSNEDPSALFRGKAGLGNPTVASVSSASYR